MARDSPEQERTAGAQVGVQVHAVSVVEEEPERDEPVEIPIDVMLVHAGTSRDPSPGQAVVEMLTNRLEERPLSGAEIAQCLAEIVGIGVGLLPLVDGSSSTLSLGPRRVTRSFGSVDLAWLAAASAGRPMAAKRASASVLVKRRSAGPGQPGLPAPATTPGRRARLDQRVKVRARQPGLSDEAILRGLAHPVLSSQALALSVVDVR